MIVINSKLTEQILENCAHMMFLFDKNQCLAGYSKACEPFLRSTKGADLNGVPYDEGMFSTSYYFK